MCRSKVLVTGSVVISAIFFLTTASAPSNASDVRGNGVSPISVAGGEQSKAQALVRRLVDANSLHDAVLVTREILALGGIATADPEGEVVPAVSPYASVTFTSFETYKLAMEARNRETSATTDLAELGEAFADFGWPFEDGTLPGEQLRSFLSTWISEAQKDPNDPQNLVPLFLAEMASVQIPPVDLSAGSYRPEDLGLTFLELHLIAAAFDRAIQPKASSAQASAISQPVGSVAIAQGDACSWLMDLVANSYGDLSRAGAAAGSVGLSEGTSYALEKGVDKLGYNGEMFTKALSVLSLVARMWRLILFYREGEITVEVNSANPLHKAARNEEPKYSAFTAHVGVNAADWAEYEQNFASSPLVRALRDCARTLGLPVLADLGDLGKDLENWRVEWDLVAGSPEHAIISLDNNVFRRWGLGQLEMDLQRTSPRSASATLVVDITNELSVEHLGRESSADVVARVELETTGMPDLATWYGALKGGTGDLLALADALMEVATGWLQEWTQPKAFGTLKLTYHEGNAEWSGKIRIEHEEEKTVSNDFEQTRHSELWRWVIQVVDVIEQDPFSGFARLRCSILGRYEESISSTFPGSCGGADRRSKAVAGFGSGSAEIQLVLFSTSFTATVWSDTMIPITGYDRWLEDCGGEDQYDIRKLHPFFVASVAGPVDPNTGPKVLAGKRKEIVFTENGSTTDTTTWDLTRK